MTQVQTSAASVGIAGAGLLGRLLAWRLSRAGWRVSVFDVSEGPQPVFRSQAGELYVPTAAAFTAAGMLSPLAELDNAEPAVAALGWRSLVLWRQIAAALPDQPSFRSEASLMLAHRADLGAAQRVLVRLSAAMTTRQWQQHSPEQHVQPLELEQLRELEPAVQGPVYAWLLPGEGQVDTVAMMAALYNDAPGVQWNWRSAVLDVHAGEQGGILQMADGRTLGFDRVIDVRGVGAKPVLPVRGVRGEVIWLQCNDHGLRRPLRLLHPRHSVYIVPRSSEWVLVGASEIESEDRGPASLRSVVELLAAAHSAVPALAEARILRLDVNLRPALPDNNPLVEQTDAMLRINGLFRHGWLLAPALLDRALRDGAWLSSGLEL